VRFVSSIRPHHEIAIRRNNARLYALPRSWPTCGQALRYENSRFVQDRRRFSLGTGLPFIQIEGSGEKRIEKDYVSLQLDHYSRSKMMARDWPDPAGETLEEPPHPHASIETPALLLLANPS